MVHATFTKETAEDEMILLEPGGFEYSRDFQASMYSRQQESEA